MLLNYLVRKGLGSRECMVARLKLIENGGNVATTRSVACNLMYLNTRKLTR